MGCSVSHMRRYGLIILGIAALAWGVSAIALDSPSLTLLSGSSTTTASGGLSPACLPATLDRTAALRCTGVDVSPAPGSGTANPHTQISFLGVPAAEIRAVSVTGAHSGAHAGSLRGYSQGDGASFVPHTPFDAGERVAVMPRSAPAARQAGGVRIPRRYPLPDGRRRGVRQPARGARRLPELRHAAGRAGADPERDRARPRSRRGRHPHDQRPRSRPVRPADLHPAGPARLVRPAAGRRNGGGPQRADLRRAARPDVVAGARARIGLRPGRRRRHELQLPDRREGARRQRAARRPARLPDRSPRHRLHHRLQPDPLQPLAAGGRARRGDHRHGDPGDRHAHRAGALGMAQPRPHPRLAVGDPDGDQHAAVGLVSHQLDRRGGGGHRGSNGRGHGGRGGDSGGSGDSGGGGDGDGGGGGQLTRRPLHLGAQHVGRLSAGRGQRPHPLAAGRAEELVQDGQGHRNGVAARRPHPRPTAK